MNILATNDDGIRCDGITCLVEELRARGHYVLTVVPDRDRSGSSHSITFDTSLPLARIGGDVYTYGGTPVDCVLAALVSGGLGFKADVVVSGINAGPNLGTDILYSGTAAAARQGSLYGIPSVAFSIDGSPPYCFAESARWSAAHLDALLRYWRKGTFINVNYPNSGTYSGCVFAYPAVRIYQDSIKIKKNADGIESYSLNDSGVAVQQGERHAAGVSDWDAVQSNKVSVSIVYSYPKTAEMTEEGNYGGIVY
ncbi:MAG: 5'/3'-nucleotidase SurE [Spirochaetaceae bacterium]|jgi:5'-nucleotidase|nr:5'/3'-nucleotidase SurE [Spirochaetaceae bacterium]